MKTLILATILAAGQPSISKPAATIPPEGRNFTKCVELSQKDAARAINYAIDWKSHFGGIEAQHCLGIAYIENDDYEIGAKILADIVPKLAKIDVKRKITILSQATNGYILANKADAALGLINQAIELDATDANLLIDRARVEALGTNWKLADEDLSKAMSLRGEIPFALRLRAEAKMQQKLYDDADRDINRAISLEPKEGDNYYVRGRIRMARKLGHAPD